MGFRLLFLEENMCKESNEMLNEQIEEAISRMKMINLLGNVIDDFKNKRQLYRSEHAILYWLNDEELSMVRKWESETGNVVFHVIKNQMEFGLCYSFLYVSTYKEEWEYEREELLEGYPLVYVKNMDDENCSEYGSIGIKAVYGGVLRTQ